jgi:hypothetical protein
MGRGREALELGIFLWCLAVEQFSTSNDVIGSSDATICYDRFQPDDSSSR